MVEIPADIEALITPIVMSWGPGVRPAVAADLAKAILADRATRASRTEAVAADVRALVIAARLVAFDDAPTREALRVLDKASEVFADRVPWDDEPEVRHG